MYPDSPEVSRAIVDQHIEKRRTAAENYRKARLAKDEIRSTKVAVWRDALGSGLITLGNRVSTHKPNSLRTV